MPIIDIVLLICFIPAIIYGIRKGFVRQFAELLSLVIGAWAAFHFSSVLSIWLSQYISMDLTLLRIISFIVIVAIVALLLQLVASLITKLLHAVMLGWVNGILGLVFGVLKVALVLGLLIGLFEGLNSTLHLVDQNNLANAPVYHALNSFAETVFPYLKTFVAENIDG